jgi:hypothetical protein
MVGTRGVKSSSGSAARHHRCSETEFGELLQPFLLPVDKKSKEKKQNQRSRFRYFHDQISASERGSERRKAGWIRRVYNLHSKPLGGPAVSTVQHQGQLGLACVDFPAEMRGVCLTAFM